MLVGGGSVYVASDDRLVALDEPSGSLAWQFAPGYPHRRVSSVALGAERMYVAAHTANARLSHTDRPVAGTVFALDPGAESVEWSVELEQPTGVATAGDRLFLRDGDALHALDRTTGDHRWRRAL